MPRVLYSLNSTMRLSKFETTLLTGWEDVYKKAQVSLWILLAVQQNKGFVDEIRYFMSNQARLEVAEQSLYRSLRRLESATMVKSIKVFSPGGPDKKQFHLTSEGSRVLQAFIIRNIGEIYYRPQVMKVLNTIKEIA